jgi:hypothetical protein
MGRILADVFFYELHEGDDEVFSDVILYSDSEWEPEDFFELVQSVRRRVQGSFTQPSLIEAIAVELERNHGFVFISDDRLGAAVNVSTNEDDNFLAELDADLEDDEEDEFDDHGLDEADPARLPDYVTIHADLDVDGGGRPH